MGYYLEDKFKCKVLLRVFQVWDITRGFKSETSLEENCKCLLQSINPSVKFEGLVWKPCYSRTSILGLKLKKTFGEVKGLTVQREDIKSEKM